MLTIRTAAAEDLPAVLRLFAFLNPNEAPLSIEAAQPIWEATLRSPLMHVFLGEVGGRAVTTCTLVLAPNLTRGGRPHGLIENVVTDPERRNQGFGKAILAAAIAEAGRQKCYKIVLSTGSKRESTFAFYEAAGFKRNTRTIFEIRCVDEPATG
jgi:GNAT superfamily N-acetyltransferase